MIQLNQENGIMYLKWTPFCVRSSCEDAFLVKDIRNREDVNKMSDPFLSIKRDISI
jgi:hypothetical protein